MSRPVRPRPDPDPVIGDGRNSPCAPGLTETKRGAPLPFSFGQAHLDGIGIMVLPRLRSIHEQLGAVPVRRAELPERGPPMVMIPPAAMFTEQKPPCAGIVGRSRIAAPRTPLATATGRVLQGATIRASFLGEFRPAHLAKQVARRFARRLGPTEIYHRTARPRGTTLFCCGDIRAPPAALGVLHSARPGSAPLVRTVTPRIETDYWFVPGLPSI